jgi:hypothetical protein
VSDAPAGAALPTFADPAAGAPTTIIPGVPATLPGTVDTPGASAGPLKIIETPEIARLRAVGLRLPFQWQSGTHELKNESFYPQMVFPNGNKLTDAELPLLLKFPNLRELICEYSQISDAGMETIGQLKQLTWLDLTGGVQGVTNKGMVHLKNLTQLQRLAILGSGITDEGVASLSELTNLKVIDLTSTNLTDSSLQHFRGLKNLQELYVHNTRITPSGIAELKKSLPNCKIEN